MNSTALASILIVILVLMGIFIFIRCKGSSGSKIETIAYPPFTIEKKNVYKTRYDVNTASKRDDSRSYYSIYYNDELIAFPFALDENSGVPGLWKVYTLEGAPQPALLAGSKSIYLIAEENDTYKMTPISEKGSDFVTLQWLDSDDEQPGIKLELYSSDDTDKSCQLKGGQFLLINKNNVLEINDLSIYSFQVNADYTNDFYANNVVAFSPDKKSIVYMGSKGYEPTLFSLLVYNFKTNQAYTIPFDRTDVRLHKPYELNADWLDTYFVWTEDTNSGFKLEKRKLAVAPNWEGYFSDKAYVLAPVKKEMLEVFFSFAKTHLQLSDADINIENYNNRNEYTCTIEGQNLEISYLDNIESVYFSEHFTNKEEDSLFDTIRMVGNAFNDHLKQGNNQALFTSY